MKNTYRIATAAAGCLALAASLSAQGQDWPQWRGPNRDGKAANFTAPATWPKELAQKWKVTVGAGDASPALVGDKLYVFARQEDNEVISCLDAAKGEPVWSDKYEVPAISGADAAIHSGPRSSPTVADGKVFTLGVCGTVSCLEAAKGKVLWRKDDFKGAWPQFHLADSPLVADGLCIVLLGSDRNGGVVAYDVASGDQKWKWTDEGPGYASPVLLTVAGAKMIVTLTSRSVVGLSVADGKLLWQAAFAPAGRMGYNAATPIVDGQTVIVCGSGRGAKALKIEKDGDAFKATELWTNPDNAVQFNTPVLKNGLLFGVSQNGKFFCINAKSGQTAWTDPTGQRTRRGFGSVVDAGSVLLALTESSQLTVFQPSDKEYTEVASFKVADKQTYAYPVPAGKGIYIKDQDSLTLYTVD